MQHFGVATLCHISRSQEQRNMACDVLPTTVIKFMLHPCRRRVGPDLDCRREVKAISVKHYEYEDQKKKIVK